MTTSQPRLRIGDAERDSAAAALSEHYANGRLTKPEYDDRLEAVWAAKFNADLDVVFTDLPATASPPNLERRAAVPRAGRPGWRIGGARLIWLVPVAVLAAVVALGVLGNAPWLLFVAFWLFACGGFGRHHGAGHRFGATRRLHGRAAHGHKARWS
ncbi:DUF1707 domain-containing protein [Phytoactinopolyspora alkaliphila]|uniref:DUF1707 domain-containing protein n=1 Tax=Phytoactinopolyspora alkaliphila TaxID=1783498 RepID=A0A6N9YLG3_9ACTN|nr:DUF1707 domain-containing protein [Phytoactinopolyspora alkaliphila]NED95760.1 DUF1707 domain-containing protein [Phytoactinopolyspora alkaliphila]